ncbi:PREDICTED: leucine-rich repeat and calponin homology domain-containing protein 3-like, partial [Gekko japonicus]|uniref:Leucine-rich repeat and calponin homology domain-containing protein 3-like n=1 Tax=Gekko japonicus TaxID=146911 RepID=A0ABM1L8E8_GEKJA
HEELYSSRPYGALDSGFNSVDSGDKRWSGNEPTDEFSDLPLRVAEITKEQRLRRESQYQENRGSVIVTNGGVEHDLDQIDFIDSCVTEEEEEEARPPKSTEPESLSSQFMAYIERRISHEGPPAKQIPPRECHRTEEARRFLHHNRDAEELRRPESLSLTHDRERQQALRGYLDRAERGSSDFSCLASLPNAHNQVSHADADLQRRREHLVERTRREAQLAVLQFEEEKMRTKQIQREAVLDFVKQKVSQSPQKQSPLDNECPFPSRKSHHTDDSALLVNGFEPVFVFEVDSNTNTIKRRPGTLHQNDDRSAISPNSPTSQTVHLSAPYPGPAVAATAPSYRNPPQRPESFLFRNAVRDDVSKAAALPPSPTAAPAHSTEDCSENHDSKLQEEEVELIEQLRKNIESRLKVSLPSDLGAALTDGVVLCHLANHVRPRSVPSIHVPSPAVPKLTMAKCRRNVENFLEACRKIGVPQERLCLPLHILEERGLTRVAETVQTLLERAPRKHHHHQQHHQQQQQQRPSAAM